MKYEAELWLLPQFHAHERKFNVINKKKLNPLKSPNGEQSQNLLLT